MATLQFLNKGDIYNEFETKNEKFNTFFFLLLSCYVTKITVHIFVIMSYHTFLNFTKAILNCLAANSSFASFTILW